MSTGCPRCTRRTWLLESLSGCLDLCARDPAKLWDVLELADAELIEALGGRRREQLRAAHARFEPPTIAASESEPVLCRHDSAYPERLRDAPLAPHVLHVRGELARLSGMLAEPVVAIVGTKHASDYGMETARGLARGLAASGVTIASALSEGIPLAAHSGALEARGAALTVMAGGVERCAPARCAQLYRRLTSAGCAISEAPAGVRARSWREVARARTLALLARLVIVVEAEQRPWALACVGAAQRLGVTVAAVPGRVSSAASSGTNALLMDGARLVRNPQDALNALYGVEARTAPAPTCDARSCNLDPQLQAIFEAVSTGRDTIAKLRGSGALCTDVAVALVELELRGLIVRGDGGRYLPSSGLRAG